MWSQCHRSVVWETTGLRHLWHWNEAGCLPYHRDPLEAQAHVEDTMKHSTELFSAGSENPWAESEPAALPAESLLGCLWSEAGMSGDERGSVAGREWLASRMTSKGWWSRDRECRLELGSMCRWMRGWEAGVLTGRSDEIYVLLLKVVALICIS